MRACRRIAVAARSVSEASRAPAPPCVLSGSFRLQARVQDVVDEERWPRPVKRGPHDTLDYEPPVPAAVLPITLLTTGTSDAGPRITKLELPSFDHFDPEASADLAPSSYTGRFALDLIALGGLLHDRQTCFVYAFAGAVHSEAVAIGVVTPDMLPPGHPDRGDRA